MGHSITRDKVIDEIKLIPEQRLDELYDFVHFFRLGLQEPHGRIKDDIMAFAGSWADLPEEIFQDITREIGERRTRAFSGRRSA